ncbi:hypothetical protein J4Q44_G00147620 [Coregonus suidteri]|uniref:Uncharacterized protein n=1 Tax=Coregonus suidteri TaxID=861788 RepID=A0AAN8LR64_9TELE
MTKKCFFFNVNHSLKLIFSVIAKSSKSYFCGILPNAVGYFPREQISSERMNAFRLCPTCLPVRHTLLFHGICQSLLLLEVSGGLSIHTYHLSQHVLLLCVFLDSVCMCVCLFECALFCVFLTVIGLYASIKRLYN